MAEYYVVRDKNTGLYFRGKGVNRWGKYYNQASIYRIRANAENTIKEVSWRGEQAEVVPIQIFENTTYAAEVKHGYWVDKPTGRYCHIGSYCSVCEEKSGIGGIESNRHKPYCQNCGARMDGTPKERGADKPKITCLNCKHLMFSDMYGECNKQLRIVNPSDTCEYAEPKERGGEK